MSSLHKGHKSERLERWYIDTALPVADLGSVSIIPEGPLNSTRSDLWVQSSVAPKQNKNLESTEMHTGSKPSFGPLSLLPAQQLKY